VIVSDTTLSTARPGIGARRLGPAALLSFAGAVAVGAALAAGELLSGFLAGVPSPTLAVARFIVDIQPPGAKELVVALFGEADKLAFEIFIVLVALGIGAWLGRLAAARPTTAGAVLVGFVVAGFVASLREPGAVTVLAAGAAGIEAVVGIMVLRRLVPLAVRASSAEAQDNRRGMPDWSRRSLLQTGTALAVGSVIAGGLGRYLLQRRATPVVANPGELPVAPGAAVLPPGADIATTDLTAGGLAPIVVPNASFYRIDTAFVVPTVDVSGWTLRIHGLVDQEVTLTYDELVSLPIIEQYVTIACVSNEVGGRLVGNAKWTGVALREVLAMAGVQPAADQLVGRSVDGFTAGMPVEWVMDPSREPLIAVLMNGEPLPPVHGYPARLIIPGLYGYVSATKWLEELELTTFDTFEGFWIPRGWAARAPILTQSRIDVPGNGANVKAGTVPIAGVAWAPDRGIQGVEVRVDEGQWAAATLSAPISKATWVQWLYLWEATAGRHTVEVRAIDGTGDVQTDARSSPAPDGARGHHTIHVTAG
jgi:DMSO/TMAO reductase YedYZ molybdopterin-dependent catalytic subunit